MTKLIIPSQTVLQPMDYRAGVDLFFKHFNLSRKNPDLIFLRQIIEKFAAIPYENISKIIQLSQAWNSGVQIRLPNQVIEEHVTQNLGGTCFSLTFALQSILFQSGFIGYPVMAHMRAGRNIHCALVVELNAAKYLVDPGYLLNEPLLLEPATCRVYHREFGGVELRYTRDTDTFDLFTFENQEIKWRYQFQDRFCPPDEFLQHWTASFTMAMMHGICLTRISRNGIIYIHKEFMRQTTGQGKKNFKLKTNYHETVHDLFGIDKQVIEQALAALKFNMQKEIELGIFIPRQKKHPVSED
jgi:arylamine N-acetyltransferase